jgi:hypothetical protein
MANPYYGSTPSSIPERVSDSGAVSSPDGAAYSYPMSVSSVPAQPVRAMSEEPPSTSMEAVPTVTMNEEELHKILGTPYPEEMDPAHISSNGEMIEEDELDALLNALESSDGEEVEEIEEIDDIEMVEVDE